MVKIAIVTGTTRPGTKAPAVADWVQARSAGQVQAEFSILDIAAFDLPLLDEPVPPMRGHYTKDHTKRIPCGRNAALAPVQSQQIGPNPAQQRPGGAERPAGNHVGGIMHAQIDPRDADEQRQENTCGDAQY